MMTGRLPISIVPIRGESLDSWLEYTADLLCCSVPVLLGSIGVDMRSSKMPHTAGLDAVALAAISAATSTSIGQLESMTMRQFRGAGLDVRARSGGAGFVGPWVCTRGTRFCPICLRENDLRWDLSWHLRWTNLCLHHLVVLEDLCPHCGWPPRWSRTSQPRRQVSPSASRLRDPCPAGCAAEALAAVIPVAIASDDPAVAAQRWTTALIDKGGTLVCTSRGEMVPASEVLTGLGAMIRIALDGLTVGHGQATVNGISIEASWLTQRAGSLGLVDAKAHGISGQYPAAVFLAAQSLVVQALAAPSMDAALAALDWLPAARAQAAARAGRTNGRTESPVPPSVRVLLTAHALRQRKHIDQQGRRRYIPALEVLYAANTDPIDAAAIPARLWPTVLAHTPDLPRPVARLFPATACVALLALGRRANIEILTSELGIALPPRDVVHALNTLLNGSTGEGILDFLDGLKNHVSHTPGPIDYRRRRRLFEKPHLLGKHYERRLARAAQRPLTDGFRWCAARYVWQLLTGNDPAATAGAEMVYGPAARIYHRFVESISDELHWEFGYVAQRQLARHRIDEPVYSAPAYDPSTRSWDAGEPAADFIPRLSRQGFRSTSMSLDLAAARAGDIEDLVHLALAGAAPVARRLCRFLWTAEFSSQPEVARQTGIATSVIGKDKRWLERSLGATLHIDAVRGRPREVTKVGYALLDAISGHEHRLAQIGDIQDPRR